MQIQVEARLIWQSRKHVHRKKGEDARQKVFRLHNIRIHIHTPLPTLPPTRKSKFKTLTLIQLAALPIKSHRLKRLIALAHIIRIDARNRRVHILLASRLARSLNVLRAGRPRSACILICLIEECAVGVVGRHGGG